MGEGGTVSALTSDAGKELSGTPLAVIDFWAPWCGPCKRIAPMFEQIAVEKASKYDGSVRFYKVNVDDEPAMTESLGIRSIPAVIGFSHGKPLERFSGRTREDLSRWIDKLALNLKLV